MTTNNTQLFKSNSRLSLAIIISLSGIVLLSACQKEPEPSAEVAVQTAPVTTDVESTTETITNDSIEAETEIDLAELENNIGAAGMTPNVNTDANTATPSPEQAIKGTQITDVQYRSESGATMSVVFETSATGVLNAIISLSNKPNITLSAPEGQGNNPTYRSKDGTIELISHGGGGNIDLMQNGQLTSFEAVSVEAEVITQI
ncbi:hypothetical protein [Psychrobacter sp. M13]|uniref:hypothetical protein n=1 Tax=Psychrobacter sp. M13 TaxID=3067275 RepID=UPI00273B5B5F|nr:hypothetical protein [Psychrobacter sp. M13]WLP93989.1 hypothetical protein Q9G97_10410 [Psychrobacter sp. M13]